MGVIRVDGQLGGSDCEGIHLGVIAQPVNALSSLTYVVVAGWVVTRIRALPKRDHVLAWAYAVVLALVGIGSVDYHGTQTVVAKPLHDWPIAGLIALTVVQVIRNWRSGGPLLPGWRLWLGVTLLVTGVLAPTAYAFGRTSSRVCHPDSYLQPHALWHFLTAIGFGLIFQIVFGPNRPDGSTPTRGQG